MIEDYLRDSKEFYELAKAKHENEYEAKRYFRVSVFCAAAAMEAFVNYIAGGFETGKALDINLTSYLNDKVLEISDSTGKLLTKKRYYPIDSKLKVIIKNFVPKYDFNSQDWLNFIDLKTFRDTLVHPRTDEDITSLKDYEEKLKAGLSSTINIMNMLSEAMYKKPLRRNLRDLIPD